MTLTDNYEQAQAAREGRTDAPIMSLREYYDQKTLRAAAICSPRAFFYAQRSFVATLLGCYRRATDDPTRLQYRHQITDALLWWKLKNL